MKSFLTEMPISFLATFLSLLLFNKTSGLDKVFKVQKPFIIIPFSLLNMYSINKILKIKSAEKTYNLAGAFLAIIIALKYGGINFNENVTQSPIFFDKFKIINNKIYYLDKEITIETMKELLSCMKNKNIFPIPIEYGENNNIDYLKLIQNTINNEYYLK